MYVDYFLQVNICRGRGDIYDERFFKFVTINGISFHLCLAFFLMMGCAFVCLSSFKS